ncbi:MAG: CarD family transcriptional regulator, partial [Candidatus Omnitrophota bacterium]
MFKSLKLYLNQSADLEKLLSELVAYGYKRQEGVSEEGEFSRRGGVIDIFPNSFELPVRIEWDNEIIASIKTFNPSSGAPLWEHKMLIILPIKKPSRALRTAAFSEEFPMKDFIDINKGDYVVHNQYGIGRFLGMEKIKRQDAFGDHLVIEYGLQEKLYVPVEDMHLVQKYIAFHIKRPKLYSLGSRKWQRAKEKARKGIRKLTWELLTLQAMRISSKGFAYSADTDWQKEFEATFPYTETPGQIKA